MSAQDIKSKYWDTCDRLSQARLDGNLKRVYLLTYGADMLAKEYREAKAKEPNPLDALFATFPSIYK